MTFLADAAHTAPLLMQNLTSFGAAGLIAWMWLAERRQGRDRERQLEDAHDRILADRVQLDAVLAALRANTEVLSKLTAAFEINARSGQNPRMTEEAA